MLKLKTALSGLVLILSPTIISPLLAHANCDFEASPKHHMDFDHGHSDCHMRSLHQPEHPMGFVRFDSAFTYDLLDETILSNQKQLFLLKQREDGVIGNEKLYIGGSMIVLGDYQHTNRDSKFPYFMRHPGSTNQTENSSQEAVIHNFQFHVTGTLTEWLTLHALILYGPQQSFGQGTITSLTRNQLQLRQGYLLLGNLDKCPIYASLGKMITPFTLGDTVNPFTASVVGHIFGGLNYGGLIGFKKYGLHAQAMIAEGGPAFRGMNSGHPTPSKLDNFVLSAYYHYEFDENIEGRIGGSYVNGSSFCQGFPIMHFESCHGFHNPAWNANLKLRIFDLIFQAEFASTTRKWPGTFNPNPPLNVFPAHKVEAFDVGVKYVNDSWLPFAQTGLSANFGQFTSGPKGSPWERQSLFVLGLELKFCPHVKAFAEYVHIRGYSPLNGLTGSTSVATTTVSDRNTRSNVFIIGLQAAI